WGQVEGIHTLAMVLSLAAAVRQRPIAMVAWATLAVLAKSQAVLLAPIWLMGLLVGGWAPTVRERVWRGLASIGSSAASAAAGIAPFGFDQVLPSRSGARGGIHKSYIEAVGYYPLVHVNGFSAWFLANPLDAPHLGDLAGKYVRDDKPLIAGIPARRIGLLAL